MKVKSFNKDIYNKYLEHSKNPISYRVFCSLLYKFFKKISKKIVEDGYILRLNYALGNIRIYKYKINNIVDTTTNTINKKKLKVDWDSTINLFKKKNPLFANYKRGELRKLMRGTNFKKVYHFNEHTEGVICKWYWEKKYRKFNNKSLFKFIPVRKNKQLLAKEIKTNPVVLTKYLNN